MVDAIEEEFIDVATDELAELLVLLVLCLRVAELSEEFAWGVDVASGALLLFSLFIF